jgi:hypothetical protein
MERGDPMGKPLWPVEKDDGSVSVGGRVATAGGAETLDALRRFVAEWNAEHATVVGRDLSTPPYIEPVDGGTVEVVFDGRPNNKMWRDWMVVVTRALDESDRFEVLGFNDRVSGRFRPHSA